MESSWKSWKKVAPEKKKRMAGVDHLRLYELHMPGEVKVNLNAGTKCSAI